MANLFSNAYKAVETYSFNKTNSRVLDTMSESAAANSALRKIASEEYDAMLESQLLKADKESHYNMLSEGIVNRYIKDSQIPNNINRISNNAKELILKDILFEVFYNALLMDDYFLRENVNNLKYLTDKYIDDNGGFKVLENAITNYQNPELLKRIKSVCESVTNKVCKRKLADSKECGSIDLIEFDMNEEEKNELDYFKKDELNIERISELVKDKVLTVVKDEQERQKTNAELIENIENDLKEDDEVTDEKSLNEAMSKIILNKSIIESSTLFDTLFRDSYQEYLLENVAITSTDKDNIDDDKEFSHSYDTELDEDDVVEDEEPPVEDKEINMDLILTEAITKYTLMETLYTLGLETYSHENIRKLTERILNPVTETVCVESENFPKYKAEFFKIFNKLKDDPSNETHRTKMNTFIQSLADNPESTKDRDAIIGICKKEIDGIIEKNPKMKDKYTELCDFITGCKKEKTSE